MRFMMMHKVDASTEAGLPPTPELMAKMGELVGGGFASGVVLAGEGLHPTSKRVRLTYSGGECTVTKGPLTGAGPVISGVTMVKVASMDEAIAWASRFAAIVGDVEIEVGPVHEPWDIGAMPRPEGVLPLRCLLLHKGTQGEEDAGAKSPEVAAGLGKLRDEMAKAGVLLMSEGLAPSAKGARLRFKDGKRAVTDGPFTESKELIAGFVIMKLDSMAEVVDWSTRFAAIVGDVEIDVRPMLERA